MVKMKFKRSLILAVILIILFSLGTVAASENIVIDESSDSNLVIDHAKDNYLFNGPIKDNYLSSSSISDNYLSKGVLDDSYLSRSDLDDSYLSSTNLKDSYLSMDSNKDSNDLTNHNQLSNSDDKQLKTSNLEDEKQLKNINKAQVSLKDSSDNVDLFINMDVKTSLTNKQYNRAGSEVPWIITVSSLNGTSYNTQVRDVLSENLQFLSYNATMGTFDSENGIWTVGDLEASKNASLTLLTRLKRDGTYINKAYATTDSNDVNLLNNFLIISIRTGSSKITSNITETSDEREGIQHNVHYASMADTDFIMRNEEGSSDDNGGNGGNGGNEEGQSEGNSHTKTRSLGNKLKLFNAQNIDYHSLSKNIGGALGFGYNSNGEFLNSKDIYEALFVYDYTRIPIIVFVAFLVVLASIVGYDKVKSSK